MTRVFSVPGISCGHCKVAIEGELARLAGVAGATVDVDAKTLTVEGSATDDEMVGAIGDAGYEVVAVA